MLEVQCLLYRAKFEEDQEEGTRVAVDQEAHCCSFDSGTPGNFRIDSMVGKIAPDFAAVQVLEIVEVLGYRMHCHIPNTRCLEDNSDCIVVVVDSLRMKKAVVDSLG